MQGKESTTVFTHLTNKVLNEVFVDSFRKANMENKNIEMLKGITKFSSMLNRDYFLERLDKEAFTYRERVKTSPQPLSDRYGRSSYFYINIAKYQLPVPQPAT